MKSNFRVEKTDSKTQIGFVLVCALVIFGIYYLFFKGDDEQGSPTMMITVTSFIVQPTQWPQTIESIGSLSAVQGVTVSAEEPGKVVTIGFESGSFVKEGDLLVALDTSVEEANLVAANARAERAKRTLTRMQSLKTPGAMSLEAIDAAEFDLAEANADAASVRAIITRKKIVAPFSGWAGIRMVNKGHYMHAGDAIVQLHAFNPLYLDLAVPERFIANLKVGDVVQIRTDAYPTENFAGKINSINPAITTETRQIGLRALIENPQEQLRAGMFAHATIVLPQADTLFPVPASSVAYAPYGNMVYVIDPLKEGADPKTPRGFRQQVVELGRRQGDQIAITKGLKAGDEVISTGVARMHPGIQVMVNNELAPNNELNPQPQDS
jgi:membrane fusion protein (multidrug efflux system)